jgi:DNA-binding HxlR family transcriptional regulator
LVIDSLQAGPRRFGELTEAVPGIAPNILSSRLRRLEEEGIVLARHYQDRPPRAAYQLTEPGRELASALRLLTAWGARHSPEADPPRHDLCGTPLEARWHCPTCDRTLEEGEDQSELRYL